MNNIKEVIIKESSPFGIIVAPKTKGELDFEEVIYDDTSTMEENIVNRKLTYEEENNKSQKLKNSLLDSIIRSRKSLECFDHTPQKFNPLSVTRTTPRGEHTILEATDLFSMEEPEYKVKLY